ncbi:MAG TPA: hypothetical protein VIE65_08010, partial [Methylobacter sp.]
RNPHVLIVHSGSCAPGAPDSASLVTFFKSDLNQQKAPPKAGLFVILLRHKCPLCPNSRRS